MGTDKYSTVTVLEASAIALACRQLARRPPLPFPLPLIIPLTVVSADNISYHPGSHKSCPRSYVHRHHPPPAPLPSQPSDRRPVPSRTPTPPRPAVCMSWESPLGRLSLVCRRVDHFSRPCDLWSCFGESAPHTDGRGWSGLSVSHEVIGAVNETFGAVVHGACSVDAAGGGGGVMILCYPACLLTVTSSGADERRSLMSERGRIQHASYSSIQQFE